MREEYSDRMGIWTTDTDGANRMDRFFLLLLLLDVDRGGVLSSHAEGRDDADVLQVLERLSWSNIFFREGRGGSLLLLVLSAGCSFSSFSSCPPSSASFSYLSGSTNGGMSAICGRLAPRTMPMAPRSLELELSKQTGTAVRGRWSTDDRMPPTPRERSMFIFRIVAGSRGTSAMRYPEQVGAEAGT